MNSAHLLVLLNLAVFTLAQSASTQLPSVSFAYPPAESTGKPRLTINVLDTIDVEWNSNYGQTWLYLWCDEYKPEDNGKMVVYRWFTKEVFASGDTSYRPWDALESDTNNRTGKYPYSCQLELAFSTEQPGILGPHLNITSRAGETIATTFARRVTVIGTTATATATPTSSSSVASSFSQTALSSSTPTATSSPTASAAPTTGDSGLSVGAKAGIAVGAVLAVTAIAVVGYLFYRNHRKLKELESRAYPQELNVEPKTTATEYYSQNYQPVPPSELDQHHRYELPSQPQELPSVESTKR